jgi:hypothetical protein
MKKVVFLALLPALYLSLSAPAHAWWPQGHSIIAQAAAQGLPEEVPSWFRKGTGQIGHDAQDPDVQKNRDLPFMSDAEGPRHYIDLELLQGRPLPATLKGFYQLCAELKLDPANVGEAPYAIAQETQRLTMIFAEARRYPKNRYIRTKALVAAGVLSHYSGDLCMPLHTTVHHDGRALPDGTSPKTGIHVKVDSLIEKLGLKPKALAQGQQPQAFPALFPAIEAELQKSRTHIDRTYALESQLPPATGDWKPSPEIQAFTVERARASTNFTASLFLTAWRDSAKIKLPTWLVRE